MLINQLKLKGYRNFKDATINFASKSLIIGSNDIGKSNMLHALRLLLDKSLSEADIEPSDSDFYVHEETNNLEICILFKDITEECVLSKMREKVNDAGGMTLCYRANRDSNTKKIDYKILAGPTEESLVELGSRFYLKVLNLKYISSKRDLFSYIRHERKQLLQDAKSNRTEGEIEEDTKKLQTIQTDLNSVSEGVNSLSYVLKATDSVNTELNNLSFKSMGQNVVFDTGASDPSLYVDNLQLAAKVNESTLTLGGDGRNNQVHLALWSARNNTTQNEGEPLEVNFHCIEEPEIHLHPHQQRKLAEYLAKTLNSQVFITTHSPQIVCSFPPESIIRLYDNHPETLAAGNGNNPFTEATFIQFGYRLNIIPAEAFYSDIVLLVEGVSEELFYKALAKEIEVDLDRYNISVLMVDGIGFNPFIDLLHSLNIEYVVRTDNDIFKVQNKDEYRLAGVQRGVAIYKKYFKPDKEFDEFLKENESKLKGFPSEYPPEDVLKVSAQCIEHLQEFDIYVAGNDLENDLYQALKDETSAFYGGADGDTVVKNMQKQKGIGMFNFLKAHSAKLSSLKTHMLAKPILRCQEIVEEHDARNNSD